MKLAIRHYFLLLIMALSIAQIVWAVDISGNVLIESLRHDFRANLFLSSTSMKASFLIPAIMLVVCLVCFAIDFGVVGVSAVSIVALFILFLLRIVYINPLSLIAFGIMVGIMIYRLTRLGY